jgi:sulfate transport system permease protein
MRARTLLSRYGLRGIALGYLAMLLLIPVALIFVKIFQEGFSEGLEAMTSPAGMHAFQLTLIAVAISVPLNTIFGVLTALLLVRHPIRGQSIINTLIDIPFAVSPIVIGLSLILVYGEGGWFGSWLTEQGIQIIFSTPGIVMATIFVSLPFVVREVVPVLQEIGDEQEQAASTLGANPWQTFWRVTLPAIRWGLAYGVVLATARALGEFGAVSVVSGRITEQTETLPLFVSREFENFDPAGAYMASVVLALLALGTLLAMNVFRRKEDS